MPFELGLAVALALENPDAHQFRVFEAVPHRFSQSLSDLAGYEVVIHHNRLDSLFEGLLDVFDHVPDPPITDIEQMMRVYRGVRSFRTATLGDDIYRPRAFRKLVYSATALVSTG
jgi:hypothetical protein